MQRISIVGSSGSGKTTLAKRLAEALAIPHVELDSIFHQPNWTPLERDEFRRQVAQLTRQTQWIIDGNYTTVRDLVWQRADTVVWLDLPRARVMARLVPRSLRRLVTRESLWNGNREQWRNLFSFDPEKNVVLWSWTRHSHNRRRYEKAAHDPQWQHLSFVRLRSTRAVDEFLPQVLSAPSSRERH